MNVNDLPFKDKTFPKIFIRHNIQTVEDLMKYSAGDLYKLSFINKDRVLSINDALVRAGFPKLKNIDVFLETFKYERERQVEKRLMEEDHERRLSNIRESENRKRQIPVLISDLEYRILALKKELKILSKKP